MRFKNGIKDSIYNTAKINDNVKFREEPTNAKVPKQVDAPYRKIRYLRILNAESSFAFAIL